MWWSDDLSPLTFRGMEIGFMFDLLGEMDLKRNERAAELSSLFSGITYNTGGYLYEHMTALYRTYTFLEW